MLWFNYSKSITHQNAKYFNTSYVMVQLGKTVITLSAVRFQYILCYGSTVLLAINTDYERPFQYILCYGSTFFFVQGNIQTLQFQYILCYGSTVDECELDINAFIFQYILCYGSTLFRKWISSS